MFTIHQIEEIHAKVRNGADFPKYIKELISIGVTSYSIFVNDGHTDYYGKDNFHIASDAKYPTIPIPEKSNTENLKQALTKHQQGQTNYSTFCNDSANAGVYKWTVDLKNMQCAYYNKEGNVMLTEHIPLAIERK